MSDQMDLFAAVDAQPHQAAGAAVLPDDPPPDRPAISLPSPQLGLFGLEEERTSVKAGLLAQRYIVPPFTVLDAKQGYWQDRKRAWLALGLQSDLGRGDDLLWPKFSATAIAPATVRKTVMSHITVGTAPEIRERFLAAGYSVSIFDPVLCEVLYSWFAPPSGLILDPFAGGSVRGVIAGVLSYKYLGVDLRPEQVEANTKQWKEIGNGKEGVEWVCGNSAEIAAMHGNCGPIYDFLLSCPPYGNLERYSDDPLDLSTMDYEKFLAVYSEIIQQSCGLLKPGCYACFVVANFRGRDGDINNLVGDTIKAFAGAGLQFYNDAVLLTSIGSLPVRVEHHFTSGRKLGRAHQNVLVFRKADKQ
jgi:hypothetical protein